MPYPSRPLLEVLAQFRDTNLPRGQTAEQRQQLLEFVTIQYEAGRSLRELAELTGRTQTLLCT